MTPSIHIVACGGTFDKIYLPEQGELGFQASILESLLKQCRVTKAVQHSQPMMIDSLDMTQKHREQLSSHILNLKASLVVVIHGTDTMVESAKALAQAHPSKTVIFTGAMIPARLPHSDASFNLGFALASVAHLKHGVWIAMNGQTFHHDQCRKNTDLGRFESTSARTS
jgi:L-asparaginase